MTGRKQDEKRRDLEPQDARGNLVLRDLVGDGGAGDVDEHGRGRPCFGRRANHRQTFVRRQFCGEYLGLNA